MPNWQRFERARPRARHGATDSVLLAQNGRLQVSRALVALWGEPALVVMLYDRDQRLIGLQPSQEEDDQHAFRLAGKAGEARQVGVTGLLRHLGWQGTASCRLPAHLEGNVLVIGPLPDEEA